MIAVSMKKFFLKVCSNFYRAVKGGECIHKSQKKQFVIEVLGILGELSGYHKKAIAVWRRGISKSKGRFLYE